MGMAVAAADCVKLLALDRLITVTPGLDHRTVFEDVIEHVINGVRVISLATPRTANSNVEADPTPTAVADDGTE